MFRVSTGSGLAFGVKAAEGPVARRCRSRVGERKSRGVNQSPWLLLKFFFSFYSSCIVGSLPSAVDVDAAASFALNLSFTPGVVAGVTVAFVLFISLFPSFNLLAFLYLASIGNVTFNLFHKMLFFSVPWEASFHFSSSFFFRADSVSVCVYSARPQLDE